MNLPVLSKNTYLMTKKEIQQKQHSLTGKQLRTVTKERKKEKNISSWWSVLILAWRFTPKPEETQKYITELVPVALITFKKYNVLPIITCFLAYCHLFANHQTVQRTASKWGVAWAQIRIRGGSSRIDWQRTDAGMLSVTCSGMTLRLCACRRHATARVRLPARRLKGRGNRLYQPWCLTLSLEPDRGQGKDCLGTGIDPRPVGVECLLVPV